MPIKCPRCGDYHIGWLCDDGQSWLCASKPYPKWRLLRKKIYRSIWKYFKIDLSKILKKSI